MILSLWATGTQSPQETSRNHTEHTFVYQRTKKLGHLSTTVLAQAAVTKYHMLSG